MRARAGVGPSDGPGRAPSLSGYNRRNLVAHLVQRKRTEDVHRLLRLEDPTGSVWYAIRQASDEEGGYESDVALAWRAADEQFLATVDAGRRAAAIDQQIFYALVTASLRDSSAQLTVDLLSERVRSEAWSAERARVMAARVSDPATRAAMFGVLAQVTEPDHLQELVADALGDPDRSAVLAGIVQVLPSAAIPAVLAIVRASGADDEALADALVASSARLEKGDAADALAEVLHDLSGSARARAVAALLPRTDLGPDEVDATVRQVLADGGTDSDALLQLLAASAGRLSGPAAVRLLDTLATVPPSVERARLAAALAATLPVRRRARVLAAEGTAAERIRARGQRAAALAALGLADRALAAVGACSPAERGAVIIAIAPLLSPEAAVDALKLVAELPSAQARADALVSLTPVLPGTATLAGLKIVESVTAPRARATMLHALAPVIPDQRLTRALMLALAIPDREARGVALARLQPRLTARQRAIPRYRRRVVATVDDEAVLREWREPTQRRAPEVADPPADASLPEPVQGDDPSAPEPLGDVLRDAFGSALLDWFRSRLPGETADVDLADAAETSTIPGPVPVRQRPEAARARLRQAIRDRHVDLSDPEVVAALDTVEALDRRTALHLGLRLAERCDRDDSPPSGPDLVAVIAVFADHGRLGEALDAARELMGPYRRSEALAAALPYVADADRSAVAAEAWGDLLAAARASSPRMWLRQLDVVQDLLPLVDGAAVGRLAQVLRTATARAGEEGPPPDVLHTIVAQAQLLLLTHAGSATAVARAADGLRTAAQVRSETVRAAILAAFTPALPRAAVGTALPLVRRLRNVQRRTERLAALAVRARDVGSTRLAADVVVEIAGQPDAGASQQILALVARNSAMVPAGRLAALWCPSVGDGLLLRHPANDSRDALCRSIAAFLPALTRVGGARVAGRIETSADTARRWWP